MDKQTVFHTIEPFFNENSKILMLGSMPSPKSRETGFFYGHPQNRFWRVLADILNDPLPITTDEKKVFLEKHKIAVWDVLASCEIIGADDNSIREPVANDLSTILSSAPISAIFTTGGAAAKYYHKLCYPKTKREAMKLPSTSPANCRLSYDKLKEAYSIILGYLN